MTNLQIAAYDPCGKTALCAGIAKKLANSGKKVGYIKPVHVTGRGNREECLDAIFLNEALELNENKDQLCPLHISQEELWRNLSEDAVSFSGKLKRVCEQAASGKDVLVIESTGALKNDQVAALACYTLAEAINARVILLICYCSDYREAEILQVARKLGDKLVGVVLNQAPVSKLARVRDGCVEYFKSNGVNVLGVLPESRAMLGVTVGEISRAINGDIILFKDKANDLVENVMLGAMSPDSDRDYFNRLRNKAVVTGYQRTDMQLAALETSIKCLIVTGQKPSPSVMVKAEDKKVPVMVAQKDVNDVIRGIEQALAAAGFHHPQKLQAISALLDTGFDYKALNAALGLR